MSLEMTVFIALLKSGVDLLTAYEGAGEWQSV